jgi:ankyrin repeat protein
MKGYIDLAKILIARGADVNTPDGQQKTALYYAIKNMVI